MLARRHKKKRKEQKENHGGLCDRKRDMFWKFGTERGTKQKVKGKKHHKDSALGVRGTST